MQDRIALGSTAGALATVPQLIFDYLSNVLGYSKYYAFQISGSIYLEKRFTDDLSGLILGGVVWISMAALLGIITVYLMTYTGSDYWWLKGLVVSNAVMYIVIYGFLYTLGGAKIVPFDPATNLTILIGNTLFGIVMSYLLVKWGRGLFNRTSF